MAKSFKVSIVIPNWNGAEKMLRHLPRVIDAANFSKITEIIVVDDGSTDDSIKVLEENFPQVKVIKKKRNTGFSSTVNLGFKSTSKDTEYVVLINNDASPWRSFLKFALPHFDDPKVFGVGLNAGGIWAVGYFKDGYFWHKQAESRDNDKTKAHQTLWVSGGSGVFRKSIWNELGGLDELFDPFYWEDTDLGYRSYKRGYKNIWEPKSLVEHYHEEGVISANFSRETINKTAERNQLLFIWKNIHNTEMISKHKAALLKNIISHPKYGLVVVSALIKLPAILKKRKVESACAKRTDEEVLRIFGEFSYN